jgi:hypothetical protein
MAQNIINEYPNVLCIISIGQISRGLISFGQVSIGLISIGQGSIALIGIGQGSFCFIYSFLGQLVIAPLINTCQVGVAWIKTNRAAIGSCPLNPYYYDEFNVYVTC